MYDDIARGLERYWEFRFPEARQPSCARIERIPGGASRETFRVSMTWQADGRRDGQQLILRRDPPSSLIDTDRELEFRAYEAVWGTAVPVPKPIALETDPQWLERPFSLMQAIDGCVASPALLLEQPYAAHRQRLGARKWQILGELARLDPFEIGFDRYSSPPTAESCARRELSYWERVIDEDELQPQPIARAAIRWLRRNLPEAPPRLALVHGDFRSGNFLFDTDGEIHAVLDWEMAHIGDPLEDLAWSLDPLWSWPDRHLAGHLLPREEAIGHWQRTSGMTVDRGSFRWWQIFASVKALGIWISSCKDYVDSSTKEPIIAMAGWMMVDRQNRILVDRLAPESSHEWADPVV